MSLKALLAAAGLKTALIIDDGYDQVPRAADLSSDDDQWANFFADMGGDRPILSAAFPDFDKMDASELRRSDAFVAAVWGAQGRVSEGLWRGLFERYARDVSSDLEYLKRLEAKLRGLGLEANTCGRTIPSDAKGVPLVLADLFLGSPQDDVALDVSIDRLKELLVGRAAEPPLVVLMSRSPRLADKKAEFRDRTCLLGAMFRVLSKKELLEGTVLERTLERLVRHRKDAIRLAAFIHAWDEGLSAAKQRFLTKIRRLDLADYGQIDRLLLDFEGQPLGSYLLDVFDRVLQYEIEASPETIRCAEALNAIDAGMYPPPYLAGSPDLQDFVHGSTYQHAERLHVSQGAGATAVSFGDILAERVALETAQTQPKEGNVLVVLTPACDLARSAAKRVLVMAGALEELTPEKWTYKPSPIRTPIVALADGRRGQIRWDPKDLTTLLPTELTGMLAAGGSHVIVGRLREGQALALQQRLLSDLGRVGLLAQMPASFAVAVEAYFLSEAGTLQRLPLPALDRDGGVYFVGRDREGDTDYRLVLGQQACDELQDALQGLDPAQLHERARATLARLKASATFPALLERGLAAPRPDQTALLEIKSKVEAGADGPRLETLGLICRGLATSKLSSNQEKYGALVIALKEPGPSPTPAEAAPTAAA